MKEDLLHYLWQYQEFNKAQLGTNQHEILQIFSVGSHNHHAGPDFINAKIKLDGLLWSGAVEIHVQASDWYHHHHHQDPAYDNVILHVVWDDDKPAFRSDGTPIPSLSLKNRVDPAVIVRYQRFFKVNYEKGKGILCSHQLPLQDHFAVLSMMENALVQRLESKSEEVLALLQNNKGDWRETFYQCLAKGFGFKVNADAFLALSKAVPWPVMLKLGEALTTWEAVYFGQAGFLDRKFQDDYPAQLQAAYRFAARKFHLQKLKMPSGLWKFSRLRSANFPTIRIAQFVRFLHQQGHQLRNLMEEKSVERIIDMLQVCQSDYWLNHHYFDRCSRVRQHGLGKESVDHLLINVVVPVRYALGKFYQDSRQMESATDLLQKLPVENNKLVQLYKSLHFPLQSAFDSQAVIELHHNFCQQHQCLRCKIGLSIMKNASSLIS